MLKRTYGRSVWLPAGVFAAVTCLGAFALSGCDRKERVVDVKTPIGDVTVDKNIDTGGVEVKTETK